jgi:ferredoxin
VAEVLRPEIDEPSVKETEKSCPVHCIHVE